MKKNFATFTTLTFFVVWLNTACAATPTPTPSRILATAAAQAIASATARAQPSKEGLATPMPAAPAPTNCVINANQLPAALGTEWQGLFDNDGVDVSFALSGPWDFSTYTTGQPMTRQIIALNEARAAKQFAGATYALKVTSSVFPNVGDAQYEFRQHADDTLRQLGVSFSWQDALTRYELSFREIVFPLKVGDSWRDSYRVTSDEGPRPVQVQYEALACHTIHVPAGRFERAILVRATLRGLTPQGQPWSLFTYHWFAPEVGEVAWLTSQVNEPQRVFRRAANFYRLKAWQVGKP